MKELRTLIENLECGEYFATDGASNMIQVRGKLPGDKEKMLKNLDRQIASANESYLRKYRENLPHL